MPRYEVTVKVPGWELPEDTERLHYILKMCALDRQANPNDQHHAVLGGGPREVVHPNGLLYEIDSECTREAALSGYAQTDSFLRMYDVRDLYPRVTKVHEVSP